jgi:hypothetical protein
LILNRKYDLIVDKLKKIKINVSEKIDQYVFADILKLSAKMKKKRKRAKKKKVRHCVLKVILVNKWTVFYVI